MDRIEQIAELKAAYANADPSDINARVLFRQMLALLSGRVRTEGEENLGGEKNG